MCGFHAVQELWDALSHDLQRLLNQQFPPAPGSRGSPKGSARAIHLDRNKVELSFRVGMMSSGLLQHDVKVQTHMCLITV